MSEPDYEIHAIRYAHDPARRLAENFMPPLTEPFDLHGSEMPIDFYVWVVVGGGRTLVVDTGFDQKAAAKRERTIVFPVEEGLRALGIAPEAVSDVVLTHLHWDHAGNHDLFPNARYHVQDREMAYGTGRCMCHAFLRRPFEADDVTALVRRVFAGRVAFHDGPGEIAPGITVHLVGGHSKGLQVVRVKTARGPVILASDASHYYANIEQDRPFSLIVDTEAALDAFRLIRGLAPSPGHIVPGHDPLVLARYPASRTGLAHIVRCDAAPS